MLKYGIWTNVITFNMIIDGACRTRDMEHALRLLRKMGTMSGGCVQPNSITFNVIVNGFCKMGTMASAEADCDQMVDAGLELNLNFRVIHAREAWTRLLSYVIRWWSGDSCRTLRCTILSYFGFTETGIWRKHLLLISDMIEKNISPNRITYAVIIEGLCRNGYLNEALNIHKLILENGLVDDNFSHNILIDYIWRNKHDFQVQPEEVIELHVCMVINVVVPASETYQGFVKSLLGEIPLAI